MWEENYKLTQKETLFIEKLYFFLTDNDIGVHANLSENMQIRVTGIIFIFHLN